VSIVGYKNIPDFRPFHEWDVSNPTGSLPWYKAYNQTIHERKEHFDKATLLNCLNVVAGWVAFQKEPLYNRSSN